MKLQSALCEPISHTPLAVSDKVAHLVAFGLMVPIFLPPLGYLAPRLGFAKRVALAAVVASGLGALLEIWQSFLPWRTADLLDWVADTVGVLAAAAVCALAAALLASLRSKVAKE